MNRPTFVPCPFLFLSKWQIYMEDIKEGASPYYILLFGPQTRMGKYIWQIHLWQVCGCSMLRSYHRWHSVCGSAFHDVGVPRSRAILECHGDCKEPEDNITQRVYDRRPQDWEQRAAFAGDDLENDIFGTNNNLYY